MDIPINSEVLRQRRKAKGWTMRDLAQASGTDHSVISRLERNAQGDVGVNTLVAIAKALEIPAEDLLPLSTWRTPLIVPPTLTHEMATLMSAIAFLSDEKQRTLARIFYTLMTEMQGQTNEP